MYSRQYTIYELALKSHPFHMQASIHISTRLSRIADLSSVSRPRYNKTHLACHICAQSSTPSSGPTMTLFAIVPVYSTCHLGSQYDFRRGKREVESRDTRLSILLPSPSFLPSLSQLLIVSMHSFAISIFIPPTHFPRR